MSYYKDQLKAFNDLDEILKTCIANGQDINIDYVLYELTKVHPVSQKILQKRIIAFAEVRELKIIKNIVKVS